MKVLEQNFRQMGYTGRIDFWLDKTITINALTEADIYLNYENDFVIKYDTDGTKMHPLVYIDEILNPANLWLNLPFEHVTHWLARISDVKFYHYGTKTRHKYHDMVLVRNPLFGNITKLKSVSGGHMPPVKIPYEINDLVKYFKKEWMRRSLEGVKN